MILNFIRKSPEKITSHEQKIIYMYNHLTKRNHFHIPGILLATGKDNLQLLGSRVCLCRGDSIERCIRYIVKGHRWASCSLTGDSCPFFRWDQRTNLWWSIWYCYCMWIWTYKILRALRKLACTLKSFRLSRWLKHQQYQLAAKALHIDNKEQ